MFVEKDGVLSDAASYTDCDNILNIACDSHLYLFPHVGWITKL